MQGLEADLASVDVESERWASSASASTSRHSTAHAQHQQHTSQQHQTPPRYRRFRSRHHSPTLRAVGTSQRQQHSSNSAVAHAQSTARPTQGHLHTRKQMHQWAKAVKQENTPSTSGTTAAELEQLRASLRELDAESTTLALELVENQLPRWAHNRRCTFDWSGEWGEAAVPPRPQVCFTACFSSTCCLDPARAVRSSPICFTGNRKHAWCADPPGCTLLPRSSAHVRLSAAGIHVCVGSTE